MLGLAEENVLRVHHGMKRTREVDRALKALDEFRRYVGELDVSELDCINLEDRLMSVLCELGRECMKEVFARADTKVPVIEHQGERWGNRRESPGTYTTMFGEIELVRSIYSRGGGGKVAVPLDLRLGIVERRYTPKVARIATHAIAMMTSDEAERFLRELGIAAVSRSTLHRLPQAVAARYETRREQINNALRESDSIPEAATVVQACLDGVMVPQDGEHNRPRGRKAERPSPARHEQRYGGQAAEAPAKTDNVKGRAWHEAMVGTLAFWNARGEHLKTIYLARMPETDHPTVASDLELELHAILRERPDLDVSFASDGDALQWTQLEGIAYALPVNESRTTTFNLDFYHAAARLHDAATAALGDSPDARVQVEQWKSTLKEHPDGARRVLKSMRYFRDHAADAKTRDDIDDSVKYLAKQAAAGRMDYRHSIEVGHPIGSGPVEAAAKTLVNVRMKRGGARYSQHGGQTILTFRSALLSERFDHLWHHLHDSYTAAVREAA
jgi:hypothetical protein